MMTVCGLGRRVQRLVGRTRRAAGPAPVAEVRPLAGGRRPLITDRLGEQRHLGARLDQVDGTTCGSAVLVALATWADPAQLRRLEGGAGAEVTDISVAADRRRAASAGGTADAGPVRAVGGIAVGFGARFDAWQKQVHRESTRFWPQALGTSPWGMVRWLRRHAAGAGPYRVRLVDDTSAVDIDRALAQADAALAAGRPVPLLVGSIVPRHYCLALSRSAANRPAANPPGGPAAPPEPADGAWRVYEPSSGQVRELPVDLVRRRALAPLLGFGRLHALLLPG